MTARQAAQTAKENEKAAMRLTALFGGEAMAHYGGKIDYDAWARAAIGPDGEPIMTSMTLRERMRNPGRLSFEEMAALAAPLGVKVKVELYAAAQD